MELIKLEELEKLTKKEIETKANNLADEIIDSGNEDTLLVLTRIVKMKDFLLTLESKIRKDVESEFEETYGKTYTKAGVLFTFTDGRKTPNYEADEEYSELKKKLKEREELLKTALKTTQLFFDGTGTEVPKVAVNYSKQSISVKY